MPRYAYQRPVNRQYAYNTKYMTNYYRPMTDYIEKNKEVVDDIKSDKTKRAPSEQPGHQSLAERLKTYSMDGSIYRSARATSLPPSRSLLFDDDGELVPVRYRAASRARAMFDDEEESSSAIMRRARARAASIYDSGDAVLTLGDQPKYVPLWMKHPYRLPVEDIHVPPHESSIWPESVPHFNLVSSYDTMIGYLGLKHPQHR